MTRVESSAHLSLAMPDAISHREFRRGGWDSKHRGSTYDGVDGDGGRRGGRRSRSRGCGGDPGAGRWRGAARCEASGEATRSICSRRHGTGRRTKRIVSMPRRLGWPSHIVMLPPRPCRPLAGLRGPCAGCVCGLRASDQIPLSKSSLARISHITTKGRYV